MKKMIFRIGIILLVLQLIICMSNINIASAAWMSDIENQADSFTQIGENKITNLGIDAAKMAEPLAVILGIVQLLVIAATSVYLLIVCVRILSNDVIDKAKAKKSLTISLIALALALLGPTLIRELINIF
jgi:hypothetical protein